MDMFECVYARGIVRLREAKHIHTNSHDRLTFSLSRTCRMDISSSQRSATPFVSWTTSAILSSRANYCLRSGCRRKRKHVHKLRRRKRSRRPHRPHRRRRQPQHSLPRHPRRRPRLLRHSFLPLPPPRARRWQGPRRHSRRHCLRPRWRICPVSTPRRGRATFSLRPKQLLSGRKTRISSLCNVVVSIRFLAHLIPSSSCSVPFLSFIVSISALALRTKTQCASRRGHMTTRQQQ